jgi:hypothetical protein
MEKQTLIIIAVGIFGFLLGYLLRFVSGVIWTINKLEKLGLLSPRDKETFYKKIKSNDKAA